jgi:dTMP kinase
MVGPTPAAKGRGVFICFEGLDRCGKSTQSKRCADTLASRGEEVEQARYPDRTTSIGGIINQYLQSGKELSDECIHLLFSANRWEAQASLEAKLQSGVNIVCDRYAYSGIAYSTAKGMDPAWCKNPDVGLVAPDLVVFLDAKPEQVSGRSEYGEERYEKMEFQKKVYEGFLGLREQDWKVVDATRGMDELSAEIQSAVDATMETSRFAPLKRIA